MPLDAQSFCWRCVRERNSSPDTSLCRGHSFYSHLLGKFAVHAQNAQWGWRLGATLGDRQLYSNDGTHSHTRHFLPCAEWIAARAARVAERTRICACLARGGLEWSGLADS